MKKAKDDPTMRHEYDFSKGVRGKYAERYARGTNVVLLDPDVSEVFPDSYSVNQALRALAEVIRSHGGRRSRVPAPKPRSASSRTRHTQRV